MTMDAMVDYLRCRGFEARKEYDKVAKAYSFVVSKDDMHVRKLFEYPHWAESYARDRIQRNFLDNIIEELKEAEKNYQNYVDTDIAQTEALYPKLGYNLFDSQAWRNAQKLIANRLYGLWALPEIKDVIFNDPATIVFWSDGTKTVVKCQDDDIYDPEKGLTMAISKKALGNKGNYCNVIKKWTEKYESQTYCSINPIDFTNPMYVAAEAIRSGLGLKKDGE